MHVPQPLYPLVRFLLILIVGCIIGRHTWGVLQTLADSGVKRPTVRERLPHDGGTKNRIEADQKARQHKLIEACSGYEVRQPVTLTRHEHQLVRDHMFIDYFHKFIYCSVPKVACTQWKQAVLKTTGKYSKKDISEIYPHFDNEFKRLSDQEAKIREDTLLDTFYTFMFVRDPVVRLVSAWKDKFQPHKNDHRFDYQSFHKEFGRAIIKKFRDNPSDKDLEEGFPVSFDEFIDYVTSFDNPLQLNEHWIPISILCRPCNIQYDFVGKFEHQKLETDYLIEVLKIKEYIPENFFKQPRNDSILETSKIMSTLSMDKRRKLYKLYKDDALLFGYDLKKYLDIETV